MRTSLTSFALFALSFVSTVAADALTTGQAYVPGGLYTIRNAYTGTYLDLANANPAQGNPINGNQRINGARQTWKVEPRSNGKYSFISAVDNVANVGYTSYNEGNSVQVANGRVDWAIYNVESGAANTYYVVAPGNLVMDLTGANPADGTPVVLWTKKADQTYPNQQWVIEPYVAPLPNGKYNSRVLELAGSGLGEGNPIYSKIVTAANNQQWIFTAQPDGKYIIKSGIPNATAMLGYQQESAMSSLTATYTTRSWTLVPVAGQPYTYVIQSSSGYALDLADHSSAEGAPVVLYPQTGGQNQQWIIRAMAVGFPAGP